MAEPLLELDDVAVHFKVGSALAGGVQTLKAVDGVTFDVKPGECLGLVGESGCGKSTLALAIMGLIPPTHGHIALDGRDLAKRQRLREITGVVPSIAGYPSGCRFHPRCPAVTDICRSTAPGITALGPDGLVRCHHHE